MLTTAIEILAATQGSGLLGQIKGGLVLRDVYNQAMNAVAELPVGEAAPHAIFDAKFSPRPVFPEPARQWR